MKNKILKVSVAVSIIVLLGINFILVNNNKTINKIIEQHVESVSSLTLSNVLTTINNEFSLSVDVCRTMAVDTFLHTWLENEKSNPEGSNVSSITNYLSAIKNEYNFDSVLIVSDYTKTYYYHGGVNKVLTEGTEKDSWYFDFKETDELVELNLDVDETDGFAPTFFC